MIQRSLRTLQPIWDQVDILRVGSVVFVGGGVFTPATGVGCGTADYHVSKFTRTPGKILLCILVTASLQSILDCCASLLTACPSIR